MRSFSIFRPHLSATAAASWGDTWDDFVDELHKQGYAGSTENKDDWGATKRAVLAFARSNDLLRSISAASIQALAETNVSYLDRKVKNARQRLSLLGGDGPKDVGTGEPSFQDVMRLLMAIRLAGDSRTPDNEAAGTPVLRQVLECARSRPAAQSAQAASSAAAAPPPSDDRVPPAGRHGRPPAQQQSAKSWRAAPWSKAR